MYYKDNQLYSEYQIRELHSNISFPTQFVAPSEYESITMIPSPATELQIATIDGTDVIDGKRVIKWSVRDKTAEEVEAERKASVPSQITPRQCRLQLLSLGLLDEVETMCSANREMQIWFEYSLDFQRSHPMTEAMAVQLGLTQDNIDTMFIEASKL